MKEHICWNAPKGDNQTTTPASPHKFKVIGVDTFPMPPEAWVYAEWDTLEEAIECARAHGGPMNVTHVYDDKGKHLFQAGTV